MIWALLAMYFLSGVVATGAVMTSGDVTELQERVATLIDDEAQRQSANAKLGELHDTVKDFEKSYARTARQLNRLYKDHEDNRQQALTILDQLNREWEAGQVQALDTRFALRDQISESEWAALFSDDQPSNRNGF